MKNRKLSFIIFLILIFSHAYSNNTAKVIIEDNLPAKITTYSVPGINKIDTINTSGRYAWAINYSTNQIAFFDSKKWQTSQLSKDLHLSYIVPSLSETPHAWALVIDKNNYKPMVSFFNGKTWTKPEYVIDKLEIEDNLSNVQVRISSNTEKNYLVLSATLPDYSQDVVYYTVIDNSNHWQPPQKVGNFKLFPSIKLAPALFDGSIMFLYVSDHQQKKLFKLVDDQLSVIDLPEKSNSLSDLVIDGRHVMIEFRDLYYRKQYLKNLDGDNPWIKMSFGESLKGFDTTFILPSSLDMLSNNHVVCNPYINFDNSLQRVFCGDISSEEPTWEISDVIVDSKYNTRLMFALLKNEFLLFVVGKTNDIKSMKSYNPISQYINNIELPVTINKGYKMSDHSFIYDKYFMLCGHDSYSKNKEIYLHMYDTSNQWQVVTSDKLNFDFCAFSEIPVPTNNTKVTEFWVFDYNDK